MLAGGEQLVELARVRVGRDLEHQTHELVRAVHHGRDGHNHLVVQMTCALRGTCEIACCGLWPMALREKEWQARLKTKRPDDPFHRL